MLPRGVTTGTRRAYAAAVRFFWLLLFTLVISALTHDGIGRRRARAASKYDLNPQLTIASNRTTHEAREEQREREAMFGWDDEEEDDGVGRPEMLTAEAAGVAIDTVVVATLGDAGEAHLLRGRLESVGIPAIVVAPPSRPGPGHHRVYVARDRAEEALDVVAELRQSWGDLPDR